MTGHDLPNSTGHQAFVDASCEFARGWFVGASAEGYPRAYIDPTNRSSIDTYGLLHARVSKTWQHRGVYGTFFLAGKNLTGKRYIAFTEPGPDGNSYQPGANREFFGGLTIRF